MIRKGLVLFLPFFFLLVVLCIPAQAQLRVITLSGYVYEKKQNQSEEPLQGVKVSVSKKYIAFTDKDGRFIMDIPDTFRTLYVFHDKHGSDTIAITNPEKELKIVFPYRQKLKDVTIRQKRFATEISLMEIAKTERISAKELLKAACCNLSESFETTPSVDVAITDAVTGYKQIQLLGLTGPNTLITRENIPDVRGLASITGLTFTPGQWIEGMQLSKGAGSVVNGFEGLAGQINVELMKPMEGDKAFMNIYQSMQGRTEANALMRFEPKEKMYTNLFLHAKSQWMKVDQNHDHYIDQPMGNTFVGANRWMWFGKNGRELQLGAKYVHQQNWGGSMHFKADETPAQSQVFGFKGLTQRIDAWAKLGKVFELKPWKSMGLQIAYSGHNQPMYFGKKEYLANEKTGYLNYIYQSILGNTNRIIKLGANANLTERHETVLNTHYQNKEITTGIFGEYAHTFSRKLNAVLGLRTDYHNLYGVYFTPRLHIRYAPHTNLALRASAGKAYRTASIFAENLGLFSTNRLLRILPSQADGVYGLQNEKAWNGGINATYKFKLNYRSGTFSTDYYYTHYLNQVVADWENPRELVFYNTTKPSYAHSFQLQLDYEPIRKFDVRLAYRLNEVQTTFGNTLKQRPLNARHRAFINLTYETRSKWSFDYTLTWTGSKRIPSTAANPIGLQLPTISPSFVTMNAHINKAFASGIELYAGGENLSNVMQQTAILDSQNPFGSYFDGSLLWGPGMGRNIYIGMRWKVKG
jgi:outer membrane receptor for ferrienterochelin and colicins